MLSQPIRRLAVASTTSSAAISSTIPNFGSSVATHYPLHHCSSGILFASSIHLSSTSSAALTSSGGSRGVHQRRPSSSKASCPPSGNKSNPSPGSGSGAGSNSSKAPAATKDQPQQQQGQQLDGSKRSMAARTVPAASRKTNSSKSREVRDSKDAQDEQPYAHLNLPLVPPTNHLNLGDVKISSFFSLHRPISVTTAFPPTTTNADWFNSIFTSKGSAPQRSNDVIYTLSNLASAMDDSITEHQNSQSEKGSQWQVVHAEDGEQMDIPSLEELVKQFRPFNVPPAPVPFNDTATIFTKSRKPQSSNRFGSTGSTVRPSNTQDGSASGFVSTSSRKQLLSPSQQQQASSASRTYKMTLTISQVPAADGQSTWAVTTSGLKPASSWSSSKSTSHVVTPSASAFASAFVSASALSSMSGQQASNQPFLQRMRARHLNAQRSLRARISAASESASSSSSFNPLLSNHSSSHFFAPSASSISKPTAITGTSVELPTTGADSEYPLVHVDVVDGAYPDQETVMELISVKRQRKLKMKKHKYKKLMRRTRTLRRKQNRL